MIDAELELDLDKLRSGNVALHGLTDADAAYTLYYDETNNYRVLKIDVDGLNIHHSPGCFVLGGVGHDGPARTIDIAPLRSALRLQGNVGEMKLKHVANGSFLDMLKSPRIGVVLDWIRDQGLFVHLQVLDVFHWSVLDIVDSALAEDDDLDATLALPIKAELTLALRSDMASTIDLFRQFGFPAIDQADGPKFYAAVRSLVAGQRAKLHPLLAPHLDACLQRAAAGPDYPFVSGAPEERHILIAGFKVFFLDRIALLRRAEHILDLEPVVRAELAAMVLKRGSEAVDHFRFVDSGSEPLIQVSDVVVGLLGKLFSYVVQTSQSDIERVHRNLNGRQAENLGRLTAMFNATHARNPALAHYILSIRDRYKAEVLLGL